MFSRKRIPPTEHPLLLNNIPLKNVKFHKHLGITFSVDMQWSHHIDCVTSHAYKRINMMRFLKYKWSTFCLGTCYKSFVRPVLEYGDIVYSSCKKADAAKLVSVQNDALRIIAGAKRFTSNFLLLNETGFQTLETRRDAHSMILFCKCLHNKVPQYLTDCMPERLHSRNTRSAASPTFRIIKASSTQYQNSLFPKCLKFFNTHDLNFRSSEYTAQLNHFRKKCNKEQNGYYLMGSRFVQVVLSQLRLRFSNLNEHLFSKGCIDSPQCRCSGGSETVKHYFIECPMQSGPREDLFGILHNYTDDKSTSAILNIILQRVNIRDHNFKIIEAVSKYIIKSNRFT